MGHELVLTETMVETLETFGTEHAERLLNTLDEMGEFPGHFLDRLKNQPGYKLRVGDSRVLVDWDKATQTPYFIDGLERTTEYRELGKYRVVWGSWRDED